MRRRIVEDGARCVRGAVGAKTALARALRVRATDAEAALWQELRRRQLGVRFRRQHVVAGERDEIRSRALEAIGVRVIRFRNEEVLEDLHGVLARVRARLAPPLLSPDSREKGEGVGG